MLISLFRLARATAPRVVGLKNPNHELNPVPAFSDGSGSYDERV